jgi:hypothetical protein
MLPACALKKPCSCSVTAGGFGASAAENGASAEYAVTGSEGVVGVSACSEHVLPG